MDEQPVLNDQYFVNLLNTTYFPLADVSKSTGSGSHAGQPHGELPHILSATISTKGQGLHFSCLDLPHKTWYPLFQDFHEDQEEI